MKFVRGIDGQPGLAFQIRPFLRRVAAQEGRSNVNPHSKVNPVVQGRSG